MKNNSPNKKIKIWMLTLIFLILFLVIVDAEFRLIDKIWWYDTMLHFLGGVWAGILFIYLFSERWHFFDGKKNSLYTLLTILGFVALLGVAWELYEFMFDMTLGSKYILPLTQPSLADTMKDLANDLLGGMVTAIAYYLR